MNLGLVVEIADKNLVNRILETEILFERRLLKSQGKALAKTIDCLKVIKKLKTDNKVLVFSIIRLLGQLEDQNLFQDLLHYTNKKIKKEHLAIVDFGNSLSLMPIEFINGMGA